jgi:hypothetical protein
MLLVPLWIFFKFDLQLRPLLAYSSGMFILPISDCLRGLSVRFLSLWQRLPSLPQQLHFMREFHSLRELRSGFHQKRTYLQQLSLSMLVLLFHSCVQ